MPAAEPTQGLAEAPLCVAPTKRPSGLFRQDSSRSPVGITRRGTGPNQAPQTLSGPIESPLTKCSTNPGSAATSAQIRAGFARLPRGIARGVPLCGSSNGRDPLCGPHRPCCTPGESLYVGTPTEEPRSVGALPTGHFFPQVLIMSSSLLMKFFMMSSGIFCRL